MLLEISTSSFWQAPAKATIWQASAKALH